MDTSRKERKRPTADEAPALTAPAAPRSVEALRDPGIAVNGFAEDGRRELYVLGNTTGLLTGSTGRVLRIRAAG